MQSMRRRQPRDAALNARPASRVAALLLATILTGCAGLERQGEEISAPAAPPTAPRTVGIEPLSNAEHRRLVTQFGGEYHAPSAERELNGILTNLASSSENPTPAYRVTILNTPIVNAFALPSGNIYVSRGLLALANDASEVAAVMAHEIAHVTARHAAARAERERQAAVITQAANVIQNRQKGEEVEASQKLSFAGFSRQQEIDADRIGIAAIARAGYDPYGASRFLTSLGRSTALRAELLGRATSTKPDILATHPSTPERIAKAVGAAREISGPPTVRNDAGYLASIEGLMFGDDPAEGVVRGRRFLHARLGFAFAAPEGFLLENSSKALLGTRDGGTEALRLDSVALPASTPLETYISSGWIDGVVPSSLETGTVNDLPAAFAIARAGEWNFRIAVLRVGGDIYRLIFAARQLNDETDRRFRAAVETFRKLDASEIAAIRPQKIAIMPGSGETVVTLAAKMKVTDRPLETFQLLNGLESGEPLDSRRSYKIVVE